MFLDLVIFKYSERLIMYRVLKWHYASMEPDDRGLHQARGYACEIVAWRFLTHLSEPELIEYLLHDLPPPQQHRPQRSSNESLDGSPHRGAIASEASRSSPPNERSGLLRSGELFGVGHNTFRDARHVECATRREGQSLVGEEEDPTLAFVGLNALEIAAVAGAKQFLSQRVVQTIVNGIWRGDIVFWNSLNIHTVKNAQYYNKRYVNRNDCFAFDACWLDAYCSCVVSLLDASSFRNNLSIPPCHLFSRTVGDMSLADTQ